jgi:hypothetical protein
VQFSWRRAQPRNLNAVRRALVRNPSE